VTDRGRAEGLLKDMAFVEPEVTIELLSARLTELNLQDSSGKPWDRASQNLDQVYPDYLIWSKSYQKSVFNKGKEALATSRFGPLGWAIQIQGDWDSVRGLGETWEKPFAGHPRVAAALALRYSDLKRWDEAERHLKRFIEWSPDYWAYELLAKNYLAQNKTEQWQQTLEESLTHEDFGLDHANAHVQLARHFMGQKQWAKARPHADAAAESGASWAMRCASECYEGLGQWDRAEHWMRQVSERYGTPDWFYWCKLTGRGNVQAAQRFAVGYLTARPDPADADDLVTFGQSWLLAGRPDQARKLLERAAQSGPPDHRVYAATLLALMADADGRADLRDQHLQRAAQAQSPLAELPRLFLDSHTRKARLDLQLVEGVLTKLSPQHATGLSFHVGRHLQLHRRQAEAAVYFQRSLAPANTDESVRALAGVALREGIR
jgi:hypothetical protein